jgi:L-threonylcarbamoyladenylate synthase
VDGFAMMKKIAYLDGAVEKRLHTILPGPFTVVLPAKHTVNTKLESELGTLGIRLPRFQAVTQLVTRYGKPLTATSANMSTKPPHYSTDSLEASVANAKLSLIDLIVDAGELPHNKPSTVVDFSTPQLEVIREGDIDVHAASNKLTTSASETRVSGWELADDILRSVHDKPVIILLRGDLGAGKTQFVKGVGERLGVYNVVSPTYVIYYEYGTKLSAFPIFVHVDLYNITEKSEFDHLGIEHYLKKGTLMCIEWAEKAGEIIEALKAKAELITVAIDHVSEAERQISISR